MRAAAQCPGAERPENVMTLRTPCDCRVTVPRTGFGLTVERFFNTMEFV
jgi:hypothetical protein